MRLDWGNKTLFELDDDPVLKNGNEFLPKILQVYCLPAAIRWPLFIHNLNSRSWYFHSIRLRTNGTVIVSGRSTGFTLMEKPCCGDSPEFSGYQILAVDLQNNDLCFYLFLPKMRISKKPGPWNEATIVVPPMEISVQCTPPGSPYSLIYRNTSYGSWLRFSPMHVNRL